LIVSKLTFLLPAGKSGFKPTCSDAVALPDIKSFMGVTPDPEVVPDFVREVKAAGVPKDAWEQVGCLDEYVLDLGNKTGWHEYNTMTNERCHDFCAEIGMPYAATVRVKDFGVMSETTDDILVCLIV
jgi:hypothetical protein